MYIQKITYKDIPYNYYLHQIDYKYFYKVYFDMGLDFYFNSDILYEHDYKYDLKNRYIDQWSCPQPVWTPRLSGRLRFGSYRSSYQWIHLCWRK